MRRVGRVVAEGVSEGRCGGMGVGGTCGLGGGGGWGGGAFGHGVLGWCGLCGGRGVVVVKRWEEVAGFMGNGLREGMEMCCLGSPEGCALRWSVGCLVGESGRRVVSIWAFPRVWYIRVPIYRPPSPPGNINTASEYVLTKATTCVEAAWSSTCCSTDARHQENGHIPSESTRDSTLYIDDLGQCRQTISGVLDESGTGCTATAITSSSSTLTSTHGAASMLRLMISSIARVDRWSATCLPIYLTWGREVVVADE